MSSDVMVAGVVNFRDVGGLPAETGATRFGVLYRSGALDKAEDPRRLRALGIRTVIDLREDIEQEQAPSNIEDVRIHRIPLFVGSQRSFLQEGMNLARVYRLLVDGSGARIVEALREIISSHPTLVHCAAGKDRTGVTIALALSAAGVERDAVVADYARTETLFPAERVHEIVTMIRTQFPDREDLIELATGSPAHVMQDLLAYLDEVHGSPIGYLEAQGMTHEEIVALRDLLVAPDSAPA